jgi:hypothetical protein
MVESLRVKGSNYLQTDGNKMHIRAKKLQHDNHITFIGDDEIVTVFATPSAPRTGELRYRIWSDETKARESTIPFRLIAPTP